MSTLHTTERLPGAKDLAPEQFQAELERVIDETAIEREWMLKSRAQSFDTDKEILAAARAGRVQRISAGTGYIAIQKLREWNHFRSSRFHRYHYSPPYLRPMAAAALEGIGAVWQSRFAGSRLYALPVTSLVRSGAYQNRLSSQHQKLTIPSGAGASSHTYGWAFDIDACGLYARDSEGNVTPVHPRQTESYGLHAGAVAVSRTVLRDILEQQKATGALNYVEELPGTSDQCFHVCIRPT